MRSREQLAWAAGFFDGEGCVRCGFDGRNNRSPALRAQVVQADRQVLERFAEAVGLGTIYGPTPPNPPGKKPLYRWQVTGRQTIALVALLWTFLSEPKREQARAALRSAYQRWSDLPPRGHPTCGRGHPRPVGARCSACDNATRAARRAERRALR